MLIYYKKEEKNYRRFLSYCEIFGFVKNVIVSDILFKFKRYNYFVRKYYFRVSSG